MTNPDTDFDLDSQIVHGYQSGNYQVIAIYYK